MPELLLVEGRRIARDPLEREALTKVDPWTLEGIEAALRSVVEQEGVKPKEVFQPVRVALAGTTVSPGIFESVHLLGREQALERLDRALERLRRTL